MAPNYGIHTPDDDKYYYCPDNECACRGTTDPFYGCSHNSCSCHYDGTPNDGTCNCACHIYCCGHCGSFYNPHDNPTCDDCGYPADLRTPDRYICTPN